MSTAKHHHGRAGKHHHRRAGKHAPGAGKHNPAGPVGGGGSGGGVAATKGTHHKHHKHPRPTLPGAVGGGGSGGPVKRGAALHDEVACCAAEALAMSLRLAGWPVTDAEVVNLYRRTADGPDAGASILETLEAAAEYGLAGIRPVNFQLFGPKVASSAGTFNFPCILGVDLPGPHTVLAAPDGWWSWGELHPPFPGAVIEEAWAVTWD